MARTVSSRRAAQVATAALTSSSGRSPSDKKKEPPRPRAPPAAAPPQQHVEPNPYQLRQRKSSIRYVSDGEEEEEELSAGGSSAEPGRARRGKGRPQDGDYSSDLSSQGDSEDDCQRGMTPDAEQVKGKGGSVKRVPKKALAMREEAAAELQNKLLRPTASFSNVPLKKPAGECLNSNPIRELGAPLTIRFEQKRRCRSLCQLSQSSLLPLPLNSLPYLASSPLRLLPPSSACT